MKRDTGLRFAVAALCVVAVGVSATTLDSTVRTDPSDVIDPDYDRLPIGQEQGSAIAEVMDTADSGAESQSESDDAGDESAPSSGAGTDAEAGADANDDQSASSSQSADRQSAAAEEQQSSQAAAGGGDAPAEPTLIDRLLALLRALAPYLLGLLAILATLGLAARYLNRRLDGREDAATGAGPGPSDPALAKAPSNQVERAWAGMISRLDLDRSENMTPRECARAAVDAGLDPEAVRTLTETFVEVRYGGRPVTERRRRAARQCRESLDAEGLA